MTKTGKHPKSVSADSWSRICTFMYLYVPNYRNIRTQCLNEAFEDWGQMESRCARQLNVQTHVECARSRDVQEWGVGHRQSGASLRVMEEARTGSTVAPQKVSIPDFGRLNHWDL